MAAPPRPWRAVAGGVDLDVRVQPGAAGNALAGIEMLADGSQVLKLRVGAPADGGKANRAAIALLAKRWKLPKSAVEIVAGQSARRKRVRLHGDPADLERRLTADLG